VLFWIFFNKTWDFVVIWIHVLVIQRSTYFYNEFYVHLLCEFFVVLDYDEMNCNIVFGVFFTMYFEVQIQVIYNNHESNVGMNGSVKFVES
jgi:hypothetical protein